EHDVVERGGRNPAGTKAEVDGVGRVLVVMLLPAEALLLHGRHQLPVADERRRGVVEVAGDAEDVHQDCRWACSTIGRAATSRGRQPCGAEGPMPRGSFRPSTSANGPRIT